MKTTQTFTSSNSQLPEGSRELGINNVNLGLVTKALTKLYTVAGMSAFREYFCNAIDASKVSGTSRPVEVTLPSRKNNYVLRIRDYGPGLTKEESEDVFADYSNSSKSSNNSLIGGFGLGSKTGIAYADKFYVETVKNGQKISFYISRVDAEGRDAALHQNITSIEATDEPNGTTIILPYQPNDFKESYLHPIAGFPEESWVLTNRDDFMGDSLQESLSTNSHYRVDGIDGEPVGWIRLIDFNTSWASPDGGKGSRFLMKGNFYSPSIVVNVGGVVYEVALTQLPGLDPKVEKFIRPNRSIEREIVLNLPIGSIDFVTSRDTFDFTPKTLAAINSKLEDFFAGLPDAINTFVDTLDEKDVRNFALVWNPIVGTVSYRGDLVYVNVNQSTSQGVAIVEFQGARKNVVLEPAEFVFARTNEQKKLLYVESTTTFGSLSESIGKAKFYLNAIVEGYGYSGVAIVPSHIYNNKWFRSVARLDERFPNIDAVVEKAKAFRSTKGRAPVQKKEAGVSAYAKVVRENYRFRVVPLTMDELANDKIVYATAFGAYAISFYGSNANPAKVVSDYWEVLDGYTVVALTNRQQIDVFLRKAKNAVEIDTLVEPAIQKEIAERTNWSYRAAISAGQYGHNYPAISSVIQFIAGYTAYLEAGGESHKDLDDLRDAFQAPDDYARYRTYGSNFVKSDVLVPTAQKWNKVYRSYRLFSLLAKTEEQQKAIISEPLYFETVKTLMEKLK